MQYMLYAIGKKEDLVSPYNNCYIGVTHRIEKRWTEHSKSKFTVGNYIRKHSLTFEENMIILFFGSSQECYSKEIEYRPYPFMGLNESIGGVGGYKIPHTQETKDKISKAHKGRKTPWMYKVVENRRSYDGQGNPNAKKWLITSPKNDKYIIEGSFINFCEENKIMHTVLRKYINTIVPPLNEKNGRGGFRPKDDNAKYLRDNTSGWQLHLIMNVEN